MFPFPIDFHRCPYNTLGLPCERVIGGGGVAEISAVAARPAQRKALSAKPEVKE